MEFLEFWEESRRMCGGTNCFQCDFGKIKEDLSCTEWIANNPMEAEKIIIKWLKDNPQKTRMDYLLEHFPNANAENIHNNACAGDLFGFKCTFENDDSAMACVKCWNEPIKE